MLFLLLLVLILYYYYTLLRPSLRLPILVNALHSVIVKLLLPDWLASSRSVWHLSGS